MGFRNSRQVAKRARAILKKVADTCISPRDLFITESLNSAKWVRKFHESSELTMQPNRYDCHHYAYDKCVSGEVFFSYSLGVAVVNSNHFKSFEAFLLLEHH